MNPSSSETILNTPRTFTSVDFADYLTNGEVNADGAIYIRLFEPLLEATENVKRFTTSMHPDHGEVNEGKWWRPVYMKDGTLTLWMADPYRSITGGSVQSAFALVRDTSLTDFMGSTDGTISTTSGVLSFYPLSINNAIVAPSNITWHFSQPDTTYSSMNFKNSYPTGTDKVWFPSLYEVETLWLQSMNNRASLPGSFYANSWLRSTVDHGVAGSGGQTANEWSTHMRTQLQLTPAGTYETWAAQMDGVKTNWKWTYTVQPTAFPNSSIRPAIHIDLNQLPPIDTSYVGDARISVGVEVG